MRSAARGQPRRLVVTILLYLLVLASGRSRRFHVLAALPVDALHTKL